MNDPTPLDDMKVDSSKLGRDPRTRIVLSALLVLWLITLIALAAVWWDAWEDEKNRSQTLAQQIALACESGEFGQALSSVDEDALCSNAEKVIENDPELQDEEIQERELQEAEIQESEIQEAEIQELERQQEERQNEELQESELQDGEIQDEELQDGEIQDEELQEGEVQDEEIQDEENQDPEIDDPDPNDQIQSGTCTFDGSGTITFTFETTSGPVTTTCTGTNTPPGQGGNG